MTAGFEEIKFCPAVFVLFDKKCNMIGLLIPHVDDGLWAGQGPQLKAAQDNIRKEFNLTKAKTARSSSSVGRSFRPPTSLSP
eukprot:2601628-Heterocapsa_arctica.AAC.1